MMELILKQNPQSCFSPLYMVIGNEVTPVGFIQNNSVQELTENKALSPIDHVDVIKKYYRSTMIIKNASKHNYFCVNIMAQVDKKMKYVINEN